VQSDDDRIEACESKLAFQEDTIQQLNDALVEQQTRIDHLEASLRSLLERIDEEPDLPDLDPADERPPHY
jgi:SlyX protein